MSQQDVSHGDLKEAILNYIKNRLEEIERDLAMSHQEKFAQLENALESSVDEDELKMAFERWYQEHQGSIDFKEDIDDIWEQALVHHDLR